MIPPIIERLVIQGDAEIISQTIGLNGANTIDVPTGKTVVILSVNLQPLLSLTDFLTNKWSNAGFTDYANFVEKALGQNIDVDGKPVNAGSQLGIVELLLNRGLTQLELYSLDKRSVFTYANEYLPVAGNIAPDQRQITYLPTVTEHKSECYSVHKKLIHVRLRFFNSYIMQYGFTGYADQYSNLVSNKDISNNVPEQNTPYDINQPYIYMQAANLTVGGASPGIFPFASETLLNGSLALGSYPGNKFVVYPYGNTNTGNALAGDNGELGYFRNAGVIDKTILKAYQMLFTPHINITYALINEQPQSLAIVSPDKYQTVIPSK
jgi:hypothetical protein